MDDQGRRASGTLARRLCLALAACAACALLVAPAALATTFTVNSTGDQVDQVLNNNDCDIDGADTCTLRAAIQETEDIGSPGSDVISFNLAPASEIQLTAVLPNIGQQLSVNGCSGVLNHAGPCVGLRGLDTSTDAFGMITGPSVTIRGLAISNVQRAINGLVSSTGLTVKNNWFGIRINGNDETIQKGVQVTDDDAVIGGTAGATGSSPADRNVFANATVGSGVGLDINVGDDAVVQGNWFGTDETGAAAKANDEDISLGGNVGQTPTATIVGGAQTSPGTCAGACNVISGSNTEGIDLQGTAPQPADATSITGNFIGLNAAGTAAIPNNVGIRTTNAPDTTIGGPAAGDRNYITGGTNPISSNFSGAPDLRIENNFIGTNTAGTAALTPPTSIAVDVRSASAANPATITGNRIASASGDGIELLGSGAIVTDNLVGVGPAGQDLGGGEIGIRSVNLNGSTISGNTIGNFTLSGLTLEASDDNVVTGNLIGTDANGNDQGGGVRGILVTNFGTNPSDGDTIGGDLASEENVISNLTGDAIEVSNQSDGVDNDNITIKRNRGANNGSDANDLFIDLWDDFNDVGDGPGNPPTGPNSSVQAPVISLANSTVAGGTASPGSTVRVFSKATASPSEVQGFLGSAVANGGGAWQLSYGSPVAGGTRVAATQTTTGSNSSELSTSVVTADTDPPETTITSGPKKRTRLKGRARRKRVSFTFVSSEPGEGGFQCQIDSKPFVLCSSPFVRKLKKGKHTFRVRAFDAASNPDPTLAIRKFRIVRRRHR